MLLNLAASKFSDIKDAQRFFHLRESRLVYTASCRVRKYMTWSSSSSGGVLILSGPLFRQLELRIPIPGRACFIRGIQSSSCCTRISSLNSLVCNNVISESFNETRRAYILKTWFSLVPLNQYNLISAYLMLVKRLQWTLSRYINYTPLVMLIVAAAKQICKLPCWNNKSVQHRAKKLEYQCSELISTLRAKNKRMQYFPKKKDAVISAAAP